MSELNNKIDAIVKTFNNTSSRIKTEEATKNALIMPFIAALGYNVFNPIEVIPEFTADVGTKKNEKVDYAITKEQKIIILIECKSVDTNLSKQHASQLYRYFSVTESRFAILTNGLIYQFYSDIETPNKMDSKPFFTFSMLDFKRHDIVELQKFTKDAFSLDKILTTASSLKYTNAVKSILEKELTEPSEEFVRFFAKKVFEGSLTKQVLDKFTNIVKQARKQFINEKIDDRFKSVINNEDQESFLENNVVDDNGIDTTDEEIEGYNIIKAILRSTVDVKRIVMRDTKSYCGILLDDNNRKPLCRLHFNRSKKYIGIISNKKEEKHEIENVDDIFNYTKQLINTALEYKK